MMKFITHYPHNSYFVWRKMWVPVRCSSFSRGLDFNQQMDFTWNNGISPTSYSLMYTFRWPMNCRWVTSGALMYSGAHVTHSVYQLVHLMVECQFILLWEERWPCRQWQLHTRWVTYFIGIRNVCSVYAYVFNLCVGFTNSLVLP